MLTFATSLYILDTTGSAAIFATLISITHIPLIIFSPIGGAIADRFSKKRIIVLADLLCLILIATLALLLFQGQVTVFLIGVVLTLIATISTCYQPVVSSALPLIMDEGALIKANAYVQVVKALSRFIGPVIAGIMFPLIGINRFVAMIGVLFLFSAAINFFLKLPYTKIKNSAGIIKTIAEDIRNGFLHISKKDKRFLKLALTLCIIMMMYTSLLSVALPFIIRLVFELSEQHFAGAKAATGLATIIGGILASRKHMSHWVRLEHLYKWIFLLGVVALPSGFSFLFTGFSINTIYLIFVSGFFFAIIVFAVIHILVFTTIQRDVPQEMIGKVTSLTIAIVIAASPIGQRIMGFLLVEVNYPVIFFTIAGATLMMAVIARRMFSHSR